MPRKSAIGRKLQDIANRPGVLAPSSNVIWHGEPGNGGYHDPDTGLWYDRAPVKKGRRFRRHKQLSLLDDTAEVQNSSGIPIREGDTLVVYESNNDDTEGDLYLRRPSEFLDGRFEDISDAMNEWHSAISKWRAGIGGNPGPSPRERLEAAQQEIEDGALPKDDRFKI